MKTYTTKHGIISIEGDESIEKNLTENGEYMFSDVEACKAYFTGTVVDVGAHVGLWTIPMAQSAEKVVSIEARADTAELLRANVAANNLTNVTIIHTLLGDPEKVYLQGTATLSGCNHYIESESGNTKGITLDSIVTDPVRFIKIDVEGMEPEILRGAKRIIADDAPFLLIEVNPRILKRLGRSPSDIGELLPGYSFYRFSAAYGWIQLWWLMDSFYNVLAVPPGKNPPPHVHFLSFVWLRITEKVRNVLVRGSRA